MNNKERLLTETLADGDGARFARAAAAYARRRRVMRHTGLAVATLAIAVAVGVQLAPTSASAPATGIVERGPFGRANVEIISDQELLAQLKDQPVLVLKGRTGITGVVFLPDSDAATKL